MYSFVHHMKEKAHSEGRDLILVDSGDLHDGTGLSDTTPLDGEITDEIFKYIDYDLLSIGYCFRVSLLMRGTMSCTSEQSQKLCIRNSCLATPDVT